MLGLPEIAQGVYDTRTTETDWISQGFGLGDNATIFVQDVEMLRPLQSS